MILEPESFEETQGNLERLATIVDCVELLAEQPRAMERAAPAINDGGASEQLAASPGASDEHYWVTGGTVAGWPFSIVAGVVS